MTRKSKAQLAAAARIRIIRKYTYCRNEPVASTSTASSDRKLRVIQQLQSPYGKLVICTLEKRVKLIKNSFLVGESPKETFVEVRGGNRVIGVGRLEWVFYKFADVCRECLGKLDIKFIARGADTVIEVRCRVCPFVFID